MQLVATYAAIPKLTDVVTIVFLLFQWKSLISDNWINSDLFLTYQVHFWILFYHAHLCTMRSKFLVIAREKKYHPEQPKIQSKNPEKEANSTPLTQIHSHDRSIFLAWHRHFHKSVAGFSRFY